MKTKVRRYLLPAGVILLFLMVLSGILTAGHFDEEDYTRYSDEKFRFSILLPRYWSRHSADLGYKQVITLRKGRHTLIKINAVKSDPQEQRKYETLAEWYFTGRGRRVNRIIKTKEVPLYRGVKGRLYILEYTRHRKRMLSRLLITCYDDNILTVECGSSLKRFYRYSGLFNTVMGSLLFKEVSTKHVEKNKKTKNDTDSEKKMNEKEKTEEDMKKNKSTKEK